MTRLCWARNHWTRSFRVQHLLDPPLKTKPYHTYLHINSKGNLAFYAYLHIKQPQHCLQKMSYGILTRRNLASVHSRKRKTWRTAHGTLQPPTPQSRQTPWQTNSADPQNPLDLRLHGHETTGKRRGNETKMTKIQSLQWRQTRTRNSETGAIGSTTKT